MRSHLLGASLSIIMLTLWPVSAFALSSAEALSPAEVVEIDPARDGSAIAVEGEAVGDVLRAQGGGSWVNVLGDEVGIGVWMSPAMVEKIEYFGHYKHSGDRIRVTGTLNRTCEQHSGEFDIHAQEVHVLSLGEPRTHTLRPANGVVGTVGCIIGVGLWLRYRASRE